MDKPGPQEASCHVPWYVLHLFHLPGPRTVTGSAESAKWKNHSFPIQEQTPPSLPALKLQKHFPELLMWIRDPYVFGGVLMGHQG